MTLLSSLVNLLAGMDDATRLAYVEVLADEQQATSIGFLNRAMAWFKGRGVDRRKVMSENGPAYLSRSFAKACKALYLKHIRTGPYTPRANGKAERLIQTLCKQCAYEMSFQNPKERDNWLSRYLSIYNWGRKHSALGCRSPQQRLNELLY
jgi:transposase InsO family protein